MDKKQQKALKIIRNLQKKMDKAMREHNSSEVERLSKEMWELNNQYEYTYTPNDNYYWVATWSNASDYVNVSVGCDFERKKNGK